MEENKSLTPERMLEECTFMVLRLRMDNYHDAEDAVAEGVLSMLEAQKRASPEQGNVAHFLRKSGRGGILNYCAKNSIRRNREYVTLNNPCSTDDGESEYVDHLAESAEESYQGRLTATQNDLYLRGLVDDLPPQARAVIRGRFFDHKTLDVLGSELNISKERVRQIEVQALDKLRHRYGKTA